MAVDAEARAQRRRQQTAARGGADQREGGEGKLHTLRPGALVEQYVYAVILHRRIEILLHDRVQTMYLVDKEHIMRLKRHQYARQVARLIEHRPRRHLEAHAKLIGHDVGQRGLSQTRRPVQQRMVESLTAQTRRLHEDSQIRNYFFLAAEVVESERAQSLLHIAIRAGCPLTIMNVKVVIILHTAKLA